MISANTSFLKYQFCKIFDHTNAHLWTSVTVPVCYFCPWCSCVLTLILSEAADKETPQSHLILCGLKGANIWCESWQTIGFNHLDPLKVIKSPREILVWKAFYGKPRAGELLRRRVCSGQSADEGRLLASHYSVSDGAELTHILVSSRSHRAASEWPLQVVYLHRSSARAAVMHPGNKRVDWEEEEEERGPYLYFCSVFTWGRHRARFPLPKAKEKCLSSQLAQFKCGKTLSCLPPPQQGLKN